MPHSVVSEGEGNGAGEQHSISGFMRGYKKGGERSRIRGKKEKKVVGNRDLTSNSGGHNAQWRVRGIPKDHRGNTNA